MFQSTRLVSLLIVVVVVFAFCTTAEAEIPQYISYQGKVTDSGGTPVPDGSYTMRFRIYNAASGGSLLWDSSNQSVTVSQGVANVLLGESPQPTLALDFSVDYWLLVTFQGVDQSPRVRLTSAGYSYMASGLVPGTEVLGSVGSGTAAAIKGTNTSTTGYGIVGVATATTGNVFGGSFQSYSTSGSGIFALASASSGNTNGVYGQSLSTSGRGVYGSAWAYSGVNYGVYGTTNSPSGYAGYFDGNTRVTGNLTVDGTLTGSGIGDITAVNAGTGLDGGGTSGNVTLNLEVPLALTASNSNPIIDVTNNGTGHGLEGNTYSTSGRGVLGTAWASSGYTSGVQGSTMSTLGYGIRGIAEATTGSNYGGYFESKSTGGTGVYGTATPTSSADRIGVHGACMPADYYGIGVKGEAYYEGVLGVCNASGSAGGSYYGSRGEAIVAGATGTAYGVYGHASGAGTHYGVYYSGGIGGSGAMKNTVRTEEVPVVLYGHLTTENWFEDFGSGTIRGGQAVVPLADDYLQTVSISVDNPMKVFITPNARIGEWWVEDGFDRFTVFAPDAPDGATFDYRIVAKRPGYESARLEAAPDAYADRFLYPDISDVPVAHQTEWLKADAVRSESVANPSEDR